MHRDKPDTVNDVNRLLLALVAVVSLSACGGSSSSSSSSSEPEQDPATYWTALVAERYGDCFEGLGTQGELVYEANKDTNREGFVVITAPGVILTFAVGFFPNTGDPFTMPFDTETDNALDPCLYGED
jgi:hypothetical protein